MNIKSISYRLVFLAMAVPFLSVSCLRMDREEPYTEEAIKVITVDLEYPEGYEGHLRSGVEVSAENINTLAVYTDSTDETGKALIKVPKGLYRVSVSDSDGEAVFNGTADKLPVSEDGFSLKLPLKFSRPGNLVIKEVYNGGCLKLPQEGTYQADRYFIIHNNGQMTEYLDSLCFGTVSPFNSQGTNAWVDKNEDGSWRFKDFMPVILAVWQFPGDGKTFPLAPGEDAVVCVNGAIDHSKQYPLSVNLNRPEYFVCYNTLYFPNETYHPAPGSNISKDRYLDVVIKTGQANAFIVSLFSPALVLFKARGTTIQEYVKRPDVVKPTPGDSHNPIVAIPWDWVIDGVEVFTGRSSENKKRLESSVDAGYVTLKDTYTGKTLHRHVDEKASAEQGYEVLMDTNNSSVDFYERSKQSLHE